MQDIFFLIAQKGRTLCYSQHTYSSKIFVTVQKTHDRTRKVLLHAPWLVEIPLVILRSFHKKVTNKSMISWNKTTFLTYKHLYILVFLLSKSLFLKSFYQESPPEWTQEAYRPPRSKYSLCCCLPGKGGGGVYLHPAWPRGGGGLSPSVTGGTYIQPDRGTTPSNLMGVPPVGLDGVLPPPPYRDGIPLPSSPIGLDGATPCPVMGYLPCLQTDSCENITSRPVKMYLNFWEKKLATLYYRIG